MDRSTRFQQEVSGIQSKLSDPFIDHGPRPQLISSFKQATLDNNNVQGCFVLPQTSFKKINPVHTYLRCVVDFSLAYRYVRVYPIDRTADIRTNGRTCSQGKPIFKAFISWSNSTRWLLTQQLAASSWQAGWLAGQIDKKLFLMRSIKTSNKRTTTLLVLGYWGGFKTQGMVTAVVVVVVVVAVVNKRCGLKVQLQTVCKIWLVYLRREQLEFLVRFSFSKIFLPT